MLKTETSGDDDAEEWSTPVNWEEDPAVKAIRRRSLLVSAKGTKFASLLGNFTKIYEKLDSEFLK